MHFPRRHAPSTAIARTGVDRAPVEVPAVGREEPRPADDFAGLDRLDGQRAAARDEELESHAAATDDVERVGRIALPEEHLSLFPPGRLRAAGELGGVGSVEAREDRRLEDDVIKPGRHRRPAPRGAPPPPQ